MNNDFINELHDANPIEQVVSEYVQLKRAGKNYVCNCPFHSEKSPSCTVFPATQSFYCFGCGVGGDVITFIKKIDNLTFGEAIEKLAARCGMQVPSNPETKKISQLKSRILDINRETANFYYKNLLHGENKNGLLYFSKRKLKAATIKKYGLGFAPDAWNELYTYLHHLGFTDDELIAAEVCRRGRNGGMYDIFRNRVMFPIVNLKGNIIGFGGRVLDDSKPKYLNSPQTLVFDKGTYCFSLNFAKDSPSRTIILAEGYMDVIAMNQAGFENVIATLGTAITPDQARLISGYADNVVIAYDSDAAGQKATQKAINLFDEVGVKTSVLKMTGAKDPDEYIKKFGAERFKLLINNADDAISFELEKCKIGLNPDDGNDKAKIIKKCAGVLAGITNTILREIYISKVADEYGFDKQILVEYVKSTISSNKKKAKKSNWKNLTISSMNRSYTASNTGRKKFHTKEEKAQREIIYFLLSFPSSCNNIFEKIKSDNFTDEGLKKIFDCIKENQGNPDFSFTSLSSFLGDGEMATVSEILSSIKLGNPSDEDISLCAEIISNENTNNSEEFEKDDLLRLANKKKFE